MKMRKEANEQSFRSEMFALVTGTFTIIERTILSDGGCQLALLPRDEERRPNLTETTIVFHLFFLNINLKFTYYIPILKFILCKGAQRTTITFDCR